MSQHLVHKKFLSFTGLLFFVFLFVIHFISYGEPSNTTSDLTISFATSGIGASESSHYQIELSLTGLEPNQTYSVLLHDGLQTDSKGNADIAVKVRTGYFSNTTVYNPSEFQSNPSGNAYVSFYLKHDQVLTIQNLPDAAKYMVTMQHDKYDTLTLTNTQTEIQEQSWVPFHDQQENISIFFHPAVITSEEITTLLTFYVGCVLLIAVWICVPKLIISRY